MKRTILTLAIVPLVAAATAVAVEYPLELKTMTREEALTCPGGYGGYGTLMTRLPAPVKTPEAKSAHPLLARVDSRGGSPDTKSSRENPVFFFDESEGTGKGYDRMIVDLNGNGDLTDDPVVKCVPRDSQQDEDYPRAWFGPVELPPEFAVGQWRPRFYAEVYIYNREILKMANANQQFPIGRLQLRTGSYLEASVELNGVKQKFGLIDGNCNFRLRDNSQMIKVNRSADRASWYLAPGDFFLRDRDGNGRFERTMTGNDAEPFSRLAYFGTQPFTVAVADDLKSVRFEPFAGPTGKLKTKPELTDLTLGWEAATDQWEALTPVAENGVVTVPAGQVRVSNLTAGGRTAGGKWLKTLSYDTGDKTFAVEAGGETTLEFGTPLKLEVTCAKGREEGESAGGAIGAVRRLFGGSGSQPATVLNMNVVIQGAGGERYSSFVEEGAPGALPPPKFEIADSGGKVIESGNFEFG